MTEPWTPSPNPGGQGRALIRGIVRDWLIAAAIPGVQMVFPGMPMTERFDDFEMGSLYGCLVGIHVGSIREARKAYTGPTDPGGKLVHYEVSLPLHHRGADIEDGGWARAEDDHDRILEALKDRLRAAGRDMGRPDVVLQVGEWPVEGSISSETDRPTWTDGMRDQWSEITCTVSQYLLSTDEQ